MMADQIGGNQADEVAGLDLPLDIVHQVVAHFIAPCTYTELRATDWDSFLARAEPAVIRYTEFRPYSRDFCIKSYETPFYTMEIPSLETVLRLRLVSRTWNVAATRLLAIYHWWSVRFDDTHTIERAFLCCTGVPNSVAGWVRSLELGEMQKTMKTFYRTHPWKVDKEPHGDRGGEEARIAKMAASYSIGLTGEKLRYDTDMEHALLRSLFDQLTGLERLKISAPEAASSQMLPRPVDCYAECYDMQALDEMISTIQYGLSRPGLAHLTDLRLELPSPRDVGRLAEALAPEARGRLQHLHIEIMDSTGPNGRMAEFPDPEDHIIFDEDDDNLWRSWSPPSNVQESYPNRACQGQLWALVASCPNLESLGIRATHFLQLDLLDWKPAANAKGLQTLVLNRLWTDVESLLRLFMARPESLRRIALGSIKLYADGGHWADVFRTLHRECTNLDYCDIVSLTYFSQHERFKPPASMYTSAFMRMKHLVWSKCDEEEEALSALKSWLVEKAGGRERYPSVARY
ncbi:hypothetical protein GQ53DRAFT_845316 [Thozetella sp. PMI_491]|nr:hypothetical protein GQ53DRAFT_845316 [Thozetella sp. PMI_491]